MNIEASILKVILYFDIFNYPLSKDEIRRYLDQQVDSTEFSVSLQKLVTNKCIFRHDNYYAFQDKYSLIENRKSGNEKAVPLLITAYKIAGLLYDFPFVRGIGISGSLANNITADKSGIDFFIITKANRLWIARTLLHLFKKLNLVIRRQDKFCMNYFVDEECLQIEEKNVFTAIELITLLPICGNGSLHDFFESNDWVHRYHPNHGWRTGYIKKTTSTSQLKKLLERMLNNKFGDWLDNYFLKLATRRWSKRASRLTLNVNDNPIGLKNGKHFSKPNPVNFQDIVLKIYQGKLDGVKMTKEQGFFVASEN